MTLRTAVFAFVASLGVVSTPLGLGRNIYVVDSFDGMGLPAAAVYNRNEVLLGMTGREGALEVNDSISFPIFVRFGGYDDAVCLSLPDTVRMNPVNVRQLPDVTITQDYVGARLLCRANEKMTIVTGRDTINVTAVYLVDYVVPIDGKPKGFKTRNMPRILDRKMDISVVKNGEKQQSSDDYDDFLLDIMNPIHFFTIRYGKLKYPQELDARENANADVKKDKLSHHFRRRGNTVTRFINGLEGEKDGKYSPGFLKFLGATMDMTRMDFTDVYAYNPYGINQSLDMASMTMALDIAYRGKMIKRLFKTKETVDCKAVITLEPLDYQLITTEESKELRKNAGDLKLSDYADGKRPIL